LAVILHSARPVDDSFTRQEFSTVCFLGNKDRALRVLSIEQRKPARFALEPINLSRDTEQLVTSSTPIEDADLVMASKAGDSAAFGELVARYDRKLFRIAYHIIHNPDDAQDVVQEAFIKVFQNLGQFRADSKFSTWLYRIVVNRSLM